MPDDRSRLRKKKAVVHTSAPQRKRAEKTDGPRKNGLWVDEEFFRNLTRRAPRLILENSTAPEEDYYLKLADVAIGPSERRKTDRVAIAFSKISQQSKKPKAG